MENISGDPSSDSIPIISDIYYKNSVNISSDKKLDELAECNRSIMQLFISTKPKELDFQSTCFKSHDELLTSLLRPQVSISNSFHSGLGFYSFTFLGWDALIYYLTFFVIILYFRFPMLSFFVSNSGRCSDM